MKRFLLAAVILLAGAASAQETDKYVMPDTLTWRDHPVLKGAQTVILVGDPTKPGPIVQRVKFPPNYKVAPHTHPYDEFVTVLSGSFGDGFGDKFDPAKGKVLEPGSAFFLPKGHPHYVWTTNQETVVQINFTGPGGIDFINPADDPRKK